MMLSLSLMGFEDIQLLGALFSSPLSISGLIGPEESFAKKSQNS